MRIDMSSATPHEPNDQPGSERVEALIECLLRGGNADPRGEAESTLLRQVALVRDTIASDAADLPDGVPSAPLARAKSLASLLPQPTASGLRAWWDRTVAAVAACVHDDAHVPIALGLRRASSTRQLTFDATASGQPISIDLEIGGSGPEGTVRIHGQVCRSGRTDGLAVALVRHGHDPVNAVTDRDGFFALHAVSARYDLAIHLGEAGTVVAPDLDIP